MKISEGEFVAFIDADDTWHEKKIEHQIKYMEMNNILISIDTCACTT